MSTSTATPTTRSLDLARASAWTAVADGSVVDLTTAPWAAVADAQGITPGRYIITSYVIGEGRKPGAPAGKNDGKRSRRLTPADLPGCRDAVEAARAARVHWDNPEWIAAQRDAAQARLEAAQATLATVQTALGVTDPPRPAALATPAAVELPAALAALDPATLAALIAQMTAGAPAQA